MGKLYDLYQHIGRETCALIVQDIENRHIIKTGTLRNSISFEIKGSQAGEYQLVYSMVGYGQFVDQGTSVIEPRYFFRKWIDIQTTRYKNQIANAIIEEILSS